jgi:hypothetical protein
MYKFQEPTLVWKQLFYCVHHLKKSKVHYNGIIHGSIEGWEAMVQAGRSRVLANPSSHLGFTQPLIEMSTKKAFGGGIWV